MGHLLGWALAIVAVPFVLTTIYFGARKGGYYDTDMYLSLIHISEPTRPY